MQLIRLSCIMIMLLVGMLSVAYANDIQLRSDVVNERLIPVIQVNGKPVLRIQDKGPKGGLSLTLNVLSAFI